MSFDGALIIEQGITFAIAVVKLYVLRNCSVLKKNLFDLVLCVILEISQ